MAGICGIVLAAGAGTRAGGPKALLRMADGTPWLALATTALLEGGCSRVVVVLGAMERLARPLVPVDPRIDIVVAPDWEDGMSASLRAGLAVVSGPVPRPDDLPGLALSAYQDIVLISGESGTEAAAPDGADARDGGLDRAGDARSGDGASRATTAVVVTLVDLPGMPSAVVERVAAGAGPGALRQAVYGGRPGHPVFIGAEHWDAVAASLSGDRGARGYLVAHGAEQIECGDLWDGEDRDRG